MHALNGGDRIERQHQGYENKAKPNLVFPYGTAGAQDSKNKSPPFSSRPELPILAQKCCQHETKSQDMSSDIPKPRLVIRA